MRAHPTSRVPTHRHESVESTAFKMNRAESNNANSTNRSKPTKLVLLYIFSERNWVKGAVLVELVNTCCPVEALKSSQTAFQAGFQIALKHCEFLQCAA